MGDDAKRSAIPIGHLLQKNFKNLSMFERLRFQYGYTLIGMSSSVCGLMANDLFRRALKVRRPYLMTCIPATALPFLFTATYYEAIVTGFLTTDLNCPTCAILRSVYVGVGTGGVATICMAGFANLVMVPAEVRTAGSGSLIKEMLSFTKPVVSRLKYFLLFQGIFSVFFTSLQIRTIEKLLQMSVEKKEQQMK